MSDQILASTYVKTKCNIEKLNINKDTKFLVLSKWGNNITINFNGNVISLSIDLFESCSKYDITEVVAVINDNYHSTVRKGQVGTIVEILGENRNVYEVEFCDDQGKTFYTAAIKEDDLLKLYFN